jgi:phage tail sheath protein FI
MNRILIIAFTILIFALPAFSQVKLEKRPVDPSSLKLVPLTHKDSVSASIQDVMKTYVGKMNACESWSDIRQKITSILAFEWFKGFLQGNKAEEAFFVIVGQQSMTQVDVQQGRLIVIVGYARRRPAEFEIQKFEQQL